MRSSFVSSQGPVAPGAARQGHPAPARSDADRSGPPLGRPLKGRYRLLQKLGEGRLGTVYLGEDMRRAQQVAVKVFRRDLSRSEEFVAQLSKRVELAAALCEKHPCLVEVYDCGRAEDGSLFVAMERLEGRSLKELIRQEGPLDIERALRLAGQIAEGLGALHRDGQVHSDLRPHHILVVRQGEEERTRLKGLDTVGLADAGLAGHMIRAGVLPSTPECVAPEQVEGELPSARTDIYALGSVLYEMLTGQPPFTASSPDAVLARQLQKMAMPVAELRPEIPPAVELKVMQALEKEPERRQRYVEDVANEFLWQMAAEELSLARAKEKFGRLWPIASVVRSGVADLGEILRDPEARGARWKLLGAVLLVALIVVPLVWMLLARRVPERVTGAETRPPGLVLQFPPPQEKGGAVQEAAAPVEPPPTGEAVAEPSPPPAPAEPARKTEVKRTPPDRKTRRPVAPVPRQGASPERLVAPPPAPQDRAAPPEQGVRRDREEPDPSAIIDWLLKRPGY
jgi:predicted Ser/Thr protein kinase